MKSLSSAFERLSFNMHHAVRGRVTPTIRPSVTARRATRARLGLECLETRDLMSGMTLANPVSSPAPSFILPVPPIISSSPLVATAVSPTAINLVWNDTVGGAEYATIYEQIGTGGWSTLTTLTGDPKAYPVTGLNPDTTYSFYVYIYGVTYSGGSYVVNSATTPVATTITPPAAPVVSLSAVSPVQVNVSWNSVAGANGYEVDEMVDGAWVQVSGEFSTSDSLLVNGLSPNTSYEFRVGTINLAGTTWSTAQSVRTPPMHIIYFPGVSVA